MPSPKLEALAEKAKTSTAPKRKITKVVDRSEMRMKYRFDVYYDTSRAKNISIQVAARTEEQAIALAEARFKYLDERQAATEKYRAENPATCKCLPVKAEA